MLCAFDCSFEDAHHLFVTRKSNGENANMGFVEIDEVQYLIAGSKNTCLIWPADSPSTEYFCSARELDLVNAVGSDIGPNVADILSTWYLQKTDAEQQAMFGEWCQGGMGTIMGELNRPWAEHLVPIGTLYLEVNNQHCHFPHMIVFELLYH